MTVATVDLDVRQKCLQSLLQTFPNMGTTSRGLVLTLVREFISLPSIFFLASCNYKIYYPYQNDRVTFNKHYSPKLIFFNINNKILVISLKSVQFSRSVVSDSLRPHESHHARLPCPSPTPRVHSDSRPSSRWCHPAISSSVVPFSSCPQSLPASVFSNESTLCMRWPKYWSFSYWSLKLEN